MTPTIRVLNFGGGVQSTCLLHLSLAGEIEPFDLVLFADTGWEPAAVYAHLDRTEALCIEHGIAFRRVRQGDIRADILRSAREGVRVDNPPFFTRDDDNKRGMLRQKCTHHYKARPLDKAITQARREYRDRHGVKPRVEQCFGISLDEIERMRLPPIRKRYQKRTGKGWLSYSYPLAWDLRWTRQHCLYWMALHEIDHPPKSACIGCPYHSNALWQDMRDNHPDEWADAVSVDRAIRGGGGGDHRASVPPPLRCAAR